MGIEQIVALLLAERDRLNRAIEALQLPAKRRGRPPKNATAAMTSTSDASASAAPPAQRKKRTFTAAQRKIQGERMKAYWKKRKAEAAKG
ncbi:MAG TPA: hypothetical protein VGL53_17535 [Bryobacteraceae bacterium]|jgi:hypothetical protein